MAWVVAALQQDVERQTALHADRDQESDKLFAEGSISHRWLDMKKAVRPWGKVLQLQADLPCVHTLLGVGSVGWTLEACCDPRCFSAMRGRCVGRIFRSRWMLLLEVQ